MTPAGAIGSDVWPGLLKVLEECGELQQVVGKLLAYPDGEHPDGAGPLGLRLEEELADVMAAAQFVVDANPRLLDAMQVEHRVAAKAARFWVWHRGAGV